MKNTYVIGDVHGCYHTLMELVSLLPSDAHLIFTGDLCDKGLYTKNVIDFVKNNKFECVMGNHDHYMSSLLKRSLAGEQFQWNTDDEYAGYMTVDNYRNCEERIIDEHIEWLKSLPSYIEIDTFFITHGFGLPYYQRKENHESQFPLRVNRISNQRYTHDWENGWEKYEIVNIFGHDNYDEVLIGKNYFGIDTGCAYENKLTAIRLGDMKIFQVNTNRRDFV